ncbi:MAG: hypothetical protein J7494_01885 [Sphingobium sp.]|nr:hypothetical protein [Sphingobium sp.]
MAGDGDSSTGRAGGIRWLRVLLIGLAAELVLSLVAIPFALMPDGQALLNIVIMPAALILFVPFGYWVARPLAGRFVLHGVLMGLAGVVAYNALVFGALSLPGAPPMNLAELLSPTYLLTHGLKLVGGGIGGFLVARTRQRA